MANCTLITTENSTVTHLLDGALRAAFLPDCALNGCTISANGSTVTMSAGTFIMCGRMVENNGDSTWSLPTNGAGAALIAVINDEELSFRTVNSAEPQLTKEDINMSGTVYETVIASCTVQNGQLTLVKSLPKLAKNGGILFGTADSPASTNYPDGTIYVKYEA